MSVETDQKDHYDGHEWLNSPEIPLAAEFMASKPRPIPSNPIDRPARSKPEYLATQYRLFRHETVEPLRQAVLEFQGDPDMKDTGETMIYDKVFVTGYSFTNSEVSCRLSFQTERALEQIDWSQSERLKAGSLVLLSPKDDSFKTTCFVAVVTASVAELGYIADDKGFTAEITWSSHTDAIFDTTQELVMLEASGGYFEANRHVMAALQENFRKEHILDRYYVHGEKGDILCQASIDASLYTPPRATACDPSQEEAWKTIVSRELAIVQGPPGTGKTFTSVIAIESFVHRELESGDQRPIIIAAQTNHAVDQLLENCMKQDIDRIVRLGGRASKESLQELSLFNFRRKCGQKSPFQSAKREALKGVKDKLMQTVRHLQMHVANRFVSPDELLGRGLITQAQYVSLTQHEDVDSDDEYSPQECMADWLDVAKDQIEDCPFPLQNNPEDVPMLEPLDKPALADEDPDDVGIGGHICLKADGSGSVFSLQSPTVGNWLPRARRLLRTKSDLYDLKVDQRRLVYQYLRKQSMDQNAQDLPQLLDDYMKACGILAEARRCCDRDMINGARIAIIGCTTTGLTKYRNLMAKIGPRVLLIEEAGETREANITSALVPSHEQLVIIGDHQQLRPHVDARPLARAPYHLDVSLLERLVKIGLPFTQLKVQRRMAPNISNITRLFYPALQDHESVKEYPAVAGMGQVNLWWFRHEWAETRDYRLSCLNPTEADMIVGFVAHLLNAGTDLSQITILTFYKGQVNCLRRKFIKAGILDEEETDEVLVRTVDGFQGEENDVIILSLVRSPASHRDHFDTQFIDIENRAVVALSRARHGLYIFGYATDILNNTADSRTTWKRVFGEIVVQECTANHFPVEHNGQQVWRNSPDEWQEVNEPCRSVDKSGDKKKPREHLVPSTRVATSTKQKGKNNRLRENTSTPIQQEANRIGKDSRTSKAKDTGPLLSRQQSASSVPVLPSRTGLAPQRKNKSVGEGPVHHSSDDLMKEGFFATIAKAKVNAVNGETEKQSPASEEPLIKI